MNKRTRRVILDIMNKESNKEIPKTKASLGWNLMLDVSSRISFFKREVTCFQGSCHVNPYPLTEEEGDEYAGASISRRRQLQKMLLRILPTNVFSLLRPNAVEDTQTCIIIYRLH